MLQDSKGSCFSRLDRLLRITTSAALYIGTAFIVVITLLVVVHVIARYAFGKPILGQVELSCYLLITAVFLMIAYTQLIKGHATIGIIADRFSKRTQEIIDGIAYALCLSLSIIAFWQSVVHANKIMQSGQVSAVLGIPQFFINYMVAVGWGLLSLVLIMQLFRLVLGVVKQ